MNEQIEEKNCKECLHFEACCKWTDFPKQVGIPVCRKYRRQSENVIELPYKVGQTVYVLRSQTSNGKNLYLRKEQIDHYRIFGDRSYMCFFSDRLSVPNYLWETTVFLTQEEAEAKMKGGAE